MITEKGYAGKIRKRGLQGTGEKKRSYGHYIQSHGYFTVDWEKKESHNVERGVGAGFISWNSS